MTVDHIRLEPRLEDDGTRYGWQLVVEFDPDWQEARLEVGGNVQGCRFSVDVPDEWVENMTIPEITNV